MANEWFLTRWICDDREVKPPGQAFGTEDVVPAKGRGEAPSMLLRCDGASVHPLSRSRSRGGGGFDALGIVGLRFAFALGEQHVSGFNNVVGLRVVT